MPRGGGGGERGTAGLIEVTYRTLSVSDATATAPEEESLAAPPPSSAALLRGEAVSRNIDAVGPASSATSEREPPRAIVRFTPVRRRRRCRWWLSAKPGCGELPPLLLRLVSVLVVPVDVVLLLLSVWDARRVTVGEGNGEEVLRLR